MASMTSLVLDTCCPASAEQENVLGALMLTANLPESTTTRISPKGDYKEGALDCTDPWLWLLTK